jgi:uncharacterized protein (TIGR00290 family)
VAEPILLSWSGGKDSARTLHELRRDHGVEVVSLLTTVTAGYDRISMHGVRRELLLSQVSALGAQLTTVEIPTPCANEHYERAMAAALAPWIARDVRRVAFGDIYLEDLRRYREEKLAQVGMSGLFPIWKRDTVELAREFLELGFRAVVTCVDPRALPQEFCGREIDASFLADLPAGVDPCGENGEFHSFVFAGPILREAIPFTLGERVVRDGFCFTDLLPLSAAQV